jgi:L-amino acid N-acyltransferase YncA
VGGPPRLRTATLADLLAVRAEQDAFWDRDLSAIHHPLLVHEFGELAIAVDGEAETLLAYLLGLLTPSRAGYIHLVAVRREHRQRGLGRALYEEFERRARRLGARSLKSFTQPSNAASIAFHRALGFDAVEVPDYVGPGKSRVVFRRSLA